MDSTLGPTDRRGEVITFYSYKGGTGRTMALSNAACIFGRDGDRRVLAIDWDLEAPGLHFYLRPTHSAVDGTSTAGVAGYFSAALEIAQGPAVAEDEDARAEAILSQLDLAQFIRPTGLTGIDLMPAGRLDSSYGDQLGGLDWRRLYELAPGLYRAFARRVADEYDVVLVDSRTGMTDISGICTSLLPDKLVVVFTPNHQSLTGIEKLIQGSMRYRQMSRDIRPLLIYPLASRIDGQRDKLRAAWRQGDPSAGVEGYQPQFERVFGEAYALDRCDMSNYFENVQAPHSPDYAFGEEIAALSLGEADRLSLVRGYESLLEWLRTSAAPWQNPHVVQAKRRFEERLAKEKVEAARTGDTRSVVKTFEEMLDYLRAHLGDRDLEVVDLEMALAEMYTENLIDLDGYGRVLDALAEQLSILRGTYFLKSVRLLLLGSARLSDSLATKLRALPWIEAVRGALRTHALSPDGIAPGDVLVDVGHELFGAGSFVEARVIQEFLRDRNQSLSGDDRRTLESMNDLATTLRAMGELADARKLQSSLVDTASRTLGHADASTRSYLVNYADTLIRTGDLVIAEDLLRRVIRDDGKSAADLVDLPAMTARRLLAQVEEWKGDHEAATLLTREVLDMSRRIFGETDERTIDAMISLGTALLRQESFAPALDLLGRVVDLRRSALGITHPLTARAIQDHEKAEFASQRSHSKSVLPDSIGISMEAVEAPTLRDLLEAKRSDADAAR